MVRMSADIRTLPPCSGTFVWLLAQREILMQTRSQKNWKFSGLMEHTKTLERPT